MKKDHNVFYPTAEVLEIDCDICLIVRAHIAITVLLHS